MVAAVLRRQVWNGVGLLKGHVQVRNDRISCCQACHSYSNSNYHTKEKFEHSYNTVNSISAITYVMCRSGQPLAIFAAANSMLDLSLTRGHSVSLGSLYVLRSRVTIALHDG